MIFDLSPVSGSQLTGLPVPFQIPKKLIDLLRLKERAHRRWTPHKK
jgi:hypothetical protein